MPSGLLNPIRSISINQSIRSSHDLSVKSVKRRNYFQNKFDVVPIKKLEPIRLMKRSSFSSLSASYLKMPSSRTKPTDQLFSQIDNIRLV